MADLIGLLLGAIAWLIIIAIITAILFYIYFALALTFIAKRTNTSHWWLAWIPYANVYLISKIAQKPWWPMLFLIPGIIANFISQNIIVQIISIISSITFLVFIIIWWWKICERRGKPGWWALIVLIPIIGWVWWLVILGILAWGKDSGKTIQNPPNIKPKVQ